MLDQLVESRDTSGQSKIRNVLLLGTLIFVFAAFVSGLVFSLWNSPLFVGGDGLELSTLVAPPIPEEAPQPEPEEEQPKKQASDDAPKIATRTEAIARIDMSPTVPPKVSTERFKGRVIPNAPFIISDKNTDVPPGSRTGPVRDTGGDTGFKVEPERVEPKPDPPKTEPPPPPPPPPAVPKRISKGVVNGQAISLPVPAYPAAARAVNAKGSVSVAIVISKSGSVMSASAVSGHPLLRQAAASAARRAKFRPTLLSGQPVEVSGVIVYNFN